IAETLDGPTVGRFRDAARRHRMMILLGSIHERSEAESDRVYNTSVLIDRDGEIAGVYRKLKLFDVDLPHLRIRESETIIPGSDPPPVVSTDIGRIGLTICFDLRFPDLYLDLRARGAEIVFVPSNFTAPTGEAHWSVLLRARAIENQFYVAAPAQAGQHNRKYRSYGHTLLVDPWGRVLLEANDAVGLSLVDTDPETLVRVRRELPMAPPAGPCGGPSRNG
ncbi:MAG: carbon-nitrogen hydrolase family protein, partial [Gammaproteobacteria bacterium]|nr:carbon-nitrogen hydrolase family protein [Gammaproteobacteria bacterium]